MWVAQKNQNKFLHFTRSPPFPIFLFPSHAKSLTHVLLFIWNKPVSAPVHVRCLAFMVKSHSVNYSKVRPLSVLCQLDSCCKASRYGCHREDNCVHAHSLIELKTWRVQRDTGAVYQTCRVEQLEPLLWILFVRLTKNNETLKRCNVQKIVRWQNMEVQLCKRPAPSVDFKKYILR